MTSDIEEKGKKVKIEFCAYSGIPKGDTIRIEPSIRFLTATRNLVPEKGISTDGTFHWTQDMPRAEYVWGETRPAEFIKGKGFGLFVDFLRDVEAYRHGISKMFGLVYEGEKAKRFARRRGFRVPTEAERELYLDTVKPSHAPPGHALMVRDF